MAARIKCDVFKLLFRLFSFLADKTGGWQFFVKPKLILGALILGISVSSCNTKGKNEVNRLEKQDDDTLQVTCYEPASPPVDIDSVVEVKISTSVVASRKDVELICDTINLEDVPILEPIMETASNERTIACDMNAVVMEPTFPGGGEHLYKFIRDHLVYPQEAIENGIQGSVVCQFTVNSDGTITDVEILKSLDRYTDKEAVRVIKLMPKWIPGFQSGQRIKVKCTLPITFKLK